MMGCTTAPGEKTLVPARAPHKDHTYELVSKVAYLIGVPLRIFENEHEPPKLELYDQLERDKNDRIIRNLCIIRTAIERNYKRINDAMRMECRGLLSMPELIPSASLQQLSDDGAFVKNNIYDFVNASEKTVIVVDCENSDPYKLCATLRNLDREIMQKITTILLFDDIHTVTAWRILESYTDIPVEHIMTERIKQTTGTSPLWTSS